MITMIRTTNFFEVPHKGKQTGLSFSYNDTLPLQGQVVQINLDGVSTNGKFIVHNGKRMISFLLDDIYTYYSYSSKVIDDIDAAFTSSFVPLVRKKGSDFILLPDGSLIAVNDEAFSKFSDVRSRHDFSQWKGQDGNWNPRDDAFREAHSFGEIVAYYASGNLTIRNHNIWYQCVDLYLGK